MKKIAITGTIGSGKSTCSEILRELGWPVFDCDEAARQAQKKDGEAYQKIVQHFEDILDENGELDRKKLAAEIFSCEKKKRLLESLVHPSIFKAMNEEIKQAKRLFFAEVPTLYESGWEIYFDAVLLISVNEQVRTERLSLNRKMNEEEIRQRVQNQISDQSKKEMATWIIENNSTKEELKEKIKLWLDSLLKEV